MDSPVRSRLTRRSFLRAAGTGSLAIVGLRPAGGRMGATSVTVAVVVDTMGAGGVYGDPVLKGMLLAGAEINARGGIGGHALNLRVGQGPSDLARVTSVVRQACRDVSTIALLGPTLSSEAVKVDPIAQAAGLPVLAVSNTVPGLTAIGNDIFRLPLGDDRIIPVVLRTVQARYHTRRAALLYDRENAATAGAARIFQSAAADSGISLVATETFPSGTTNFATHLDIVKGANPDVIFVSALAQDAVLILRQRLVAGIPATIPIVGANGLNTPAIIRGAGDAANGVIVGTIYNPNAASTRNRHFRAAFTRRYGHSPDVFAAQGYDGVYTLAAALQRAHTTDDRRGLRAALAGLKDVPSLLSATGHFSFTPQREANLTPTVQIAHRGTFIPFP